MTTFTKAELDNMFFPNTNKYGYACRHIDIKMNVPSDIINNLKQKIIEDNKTPVLVSCGLFTSTFMWNYQNYQFDDFTNKIKEINVGEHFYTSCDGYTDLDDIQNYYWLRYLYFVNQVDCFFVSFQ